MFVLVSGVSTATSPRWRVIYISRLGSRLWDRPAKPGIAVVSQFEFQLSVESECGAGGFRPNISVAAPFVWRCLTGSPVAPVSTPRSSVGSRTGAPV